MEKLLAELVEYYNMLVMKNGIKNALDLLDLIL